MLIKTTSNFSKVHSAEGWIVGPYTITVSVAYILKYWKYWIENLKRKSVIKSYVVKQALDCLSLKVQVLFQLLVACGGKSRPNGMTVFFISHIALRVIFFDFFWELKNY